MHGKLNNKGDILASEVLKIILAALGIVALVYLAFSMYGLLKSNTRLEQAKAGLDEIDGKIKSLSAGTSANYLITSPNEWYLVLFDKESQKPGNCRGSYCLCICSSVDDAIEGVLKACEKEGKCIETSAISMEEKCEDAGDAVPCVYLEELPINLIIEKGESLTKLALKKNNEQTG